MVARKLLRIFRGSFTLGASLWLHRAGVAELVDAAGLGPAGRKPLEVRVLSPALDYLEEAQVANPLARIRDRSGA